MSNVVPEGWEETKLGHVASLTMGQSPSSDTYNTEAVGLPFFQGKADFGSRSPKVRYWCSKPTKIADEGSILFSVRAPVGEVNITTATCCIGRGLSGIKAASADQEFLYQKLQYVKPLFALLSQGSTFEAVNGGEMKEFPLTLPPLPEQKKIAAILSSVDEVIEKTRAQIDKLKDLKTGMMQELLTKGIGPGGVPHTEFKDSPVGRIPAGWSIQRLLRFALNEKHSFVNGPFGSDLLSSELTASGVPVIYVRDLKNSKYDRVSTVCVTEGKADSLPACNVIKGDILVAKVGDPPCNAGVYEFYSRAIVTQDVIRIRPSEEVDPYFFAYLLNSPLGRSQIEKIEIAGTRKRVSLTEFKNLLFPMPPPEEQVHIGQTLRSVDNRIYKLEQKNAAYTKAKKALMQDLLTGKVRVNVDARELADA